MALEKKKGKSSLHYSSTHDKSQDVFQSDNMDIKNQLCRHQVNKSISNTPERSSLSCSSKHDETTKRHPIVLLQRLKIYPDTDVLVRDNKIYVEYPKHMNCSNEFRKLYINMCLNNMCIEQNKKLHFEYKHESSTLVISNKYYCKSSKDCGLKSKIFQRPINETSSNGTFLLNSRKPRIYYKNKQSIDSYVKNNHKPKMKCKREGESKINGSIVIVEKIDKKIEFMNYFELKPKLRVKLPDFNKSPEKCHVNTNKLTPKVVLKRLQPFPKSRRIRQLK